VELVTGDERTLEELESALRRAGAEPRGLVPKLLRALDLPVESESAPLSPDTPPGAALGYALLAQQRSLLDHDPGTRLGEDAEDLHQMRVATRRARAFLRVARPLVDPTWAEGLRGELGWLGSALGPARDADVLLEHLRAQVETLGAPAPQAQGLVRSLEEERDRAREAARAALSMPRYFALLDALEQAGRPRLASDGATTLAALWWKEFGRTRRVFTSLDRNSTDADLHDARIHAKRARYAAELAAHELGKPGRRFVDAAKRVQDVLGEHQDSAVAKERILAWGVRHPGSEEAVEALLERERRRRRKARREWPDAWETLRRRARAARP
jgi:CHAD domain-containing protein